MHSDLLDSAAEAALPECPGLLSPTLRRDLTDLNVQYLVPGVDGLRATLMVHNVLDNRAQFFIGAPQIGRLSTFRLDYTF